MEAPEKIYVALNEIDEDERTFVLDHRTDYPICTEYTRTDAFIEKADKFISTFFHPDDTELRNCLLKKFHEYMKGE